jgi:hypothetical protein
MSQSLSNSRKTENESFFRKHNEEVQKTRDRTNSLAREDHQLFLIDNANLKLLYLCECADENCTKRIPLMSRAYNKIHENRKYFVIAPGHEVLKIERVIKKNLKYTLVEKDVRPNENSPILSKTDVDNT